MERIGNASVTLVGVSNQAVCSGIAYYTVSLYHESLSPSLSILHTLISVDYLSEYRLEGLRSGPFDVINHSV